MGTVRHQHIVMRVVRPPWGFHTGALPANSCHTQVSCKPCMQVASAHAAYDAIYFPHNVDFRGRAYPMPPHLNHMGADVCRGLLQFSEAKPLGRNGFRWLLIHLANVFGVVDKKAFDTRALWALEHIPDVLDSADRPLGGRRWWLRADKPWTALAVCMDIAAALRHGSVSQYRSRIPVHQDGSCNGLQHYAALGRDESGAMAVNLVDAEEPQDVYSMVAMRFAKLVADEAAGDESLKHVQHARALLGQTDRKLVKQTVMTTVYGVTMRGARDQIASRCGAHTRRSNAALAQWRRAAVAHRDPSSAVCRSEHARPAMLCAELHNAVCRERL
jgi:DNA-directed RNA polymerase, mitochondrial